ncbi:DUF4407 domain-containing protein [Arthrobacter sp. CJ23]|uniref:DUF4407 domain-containing protein n=1 Tax=Arthrobacter sp. CJ23 TaxID=2972479 RepID=UPI00215BFE44|nr:DUF4407 domain-containing protein [Arthrobacter sp. CJ23]UVJ38056.1 DUF4407 domain-containing protein [Arthrobacter sp. CJ23]
MGSALLLSAAIGTLSVTSASAIIWDLPWFALAAVGGVYFFLILGFERWLVTDPRAGFHATASDGAFTMVSRWAGHLIVELIKIAPRLIISIITSLLFAEILLLTVFAAEIQEQLKINQVAEEGRWNTKVDELTNKLSSDSKATIQSADDRKVKLQDSFNNATTAIKAATQQRDASIGQAAALGATTTCYPFTYTWYDLAGVARQGWDEGCPPEVKAANSAYENAIGPYLNLSQASVDSAKRAIDTEEAVIKARAYVAGGARDEAKQVLHDSFPDVLGSPGLLLRMGALDQLTLPPAPGCHASPSSTASSPASGPVENATPAPGSALGGTTNECNPYYSDGAARQSQLWRWMIFAFEVAPVVLKFVRAILPRTGYADMMSAVDDRAHSWAQIVRNRDRWRRKGEDRRAKAEMRMAVEDALTEAEIHVRANARARERFRLRTMFDRFNAANRPDPAEGDSGLPDLVDLLDTEDQWQPGEKRHDNSRNARVIDDDSFLYD